MNGATAWEPRSARTGSRWRHVWAESGKPCRQSANGPQPTSRTVKARPLASTTRSVGPVCSCCATSGVHAARFGRQPRCGCPSAALSGGPCEQYLMVDMESGPSESVPLRASDAEREKAAALLREAAAEGRINLEELS